MSFPYPPISCNSCCIYPLDCLQENVSSLWQLRILPRYSPATAFVPSPKMVCMDWWDGWFEDFLRCPQSTWIWLGGCQVSNSVISIISIFHWMSSNVIQCHPVIPFHHQVSCSQAVRGRSRCLRSNKTDCRISSSNITTIKSQIFEAKYSKDF